MRKVIVNSTPLIVLCSIGRLEILQKNVRRNNDTCCGLP
jgi:predicted nucleic acid-binding protein